MSENSNNKGPKKQSEEADSIHFTDTHTHRRQTNQKKRQGKKGSEEYSKNK